MKATVLFLLCAAAVRTYSLWAQTNEVTAKIISDFVNKDLPAGKKLFILEIVPGNFTNSGYDEFLVSFDTMRNADLYSRGVLKSVEKAGVLLSIRIRSLFPIRWMIMKQAIWMDWRRFIRSC